MTDGNPIAGLKDTQAEITRKASTVVRVLERALDEVPLGQIGGNHLTAILAAHGYPHVKQMRDHIAALRPLGDLPVTFDIPTEPTRPGHVRCTDCGREYRTGAGIANHVRRAHTEKEPAMPATFDCPDCEATYTKPASLNAHHLINHEATRPGGRAAS